MWRNVLVFVLLLASCSATPTQEKSDILYFVEKFQVDLDIYYLDNGWQMDTDECSNGFPLPRVASYETVIALANGEIRVILTPGETTAKIEATPGIIPEEEWNTVWHGGILEMNREITIAVVNGDETKYESVANCAFNLMSG